MRQGAAGHDADRDAWKDAAAPLLETRGLAIGYGGGSGRRAGACALTEGLDLEVRALEFLWKKEEELARIIDNELTPRRMLEAHLRRLPIKLRPRPSGPLLADGEA